MSGGFDAFDLSSVTSFAADVGSAVTDFGTEFMTSVGGLDFQIPSFDIPSIGGFGEVGSFAGNASWFDTFNPGSILDSIPSVSDFNISSLTDSLPSLSSIKGLADTVSSDLGSVVKTAQQGLAAYQKAAPAVNAVSSALGIQNPLNQIAQATQQAVGIAGTASGIASTASSLTDLSLSSIISNPTAISAVASSTGIPPKLLSSAASVATSGSSGFGLPSLSSLTSSPSIVSSGAAALGINPGIAQSLTSKVTSLFAADPNASNARDVATGLPINTAREVDAYGLNILSAAETAQITKNISPSFINSLVDPNTPIEVINPATGEITYTSSPVSGSPAIDNYNQAKQAFDATTAAISQYITEKTDATNSILKISDNISNINNRLEDPNTTEAEKQLLQEQLKGEYDGLAVQTQILDQTNNAITQATAARDQASAIIISTDQTATSSAAPVTDSYYGVPVASTTTNTIVGTPGTLTNINITNLVQQARQQQTLRNLTQTKAQRTDWRVKLRLAPNSTYLYNDPNGAGILDPLSAKTGTDGVIFPYTPAIETAYKANYTAYDLTHSNFRGYFYQGSYVDAINLRCTFTAQDTDEANYLLAVIHFFRSVTKMFYGKDTERGSPPPLVFLSGLGDYQFNEHPCVVSQFNYSLPPDVDYIRARSTLDMSTNLLNNRTRTSIPGNPLSYGINRLLSSGLFQGATPNPATVGNLPAESPTYVPTKMEIALTMFPIQSRQQVSTQFSLKAFANGNLLRGGFW